MATTKIVNQSIHFPTAKNVGIATKIEFLYCLACEILSKQLLEVSILRSKMADQNVFRSNGNIGFWFQRGLSFPKMYLVTTLHKMRAKIHSNPDYSQDFCFWGGDPVDSTQPCILLKSYTRLKLSRTAGGSAGATAVSRVMGGAPERNKFDFF